MPAHRLLACLSNGEHVEIGRSASLDIILERHMAVQFTRLWDNHERLFIDGHEVKFTRAREVGSADFPNLRRFPMSAIQTAPKRSLNLRGKRRPATGEFKDFKQARTVAKARNITNGRGYRAVRAQDGRGAIIFRPAVATNKQRRTRVVL